MSKMPNSLSGLFLVFVFLVLAAIAMVLYSAEEQKAAVDKNLLLPRISAALRNTWSLIRPWVDMGLEKKDIDSLENTDNEPEAISGFMSNIKNKIKEEWQASSGADK